MHKPKNTTFVGIVIWLIDSICYICKKINLNKIIKAVISITGIFTLLCLIYGAITTHIDHRSAEKVFEKYKNKNIKETK